MTFISNLIDEGDYCPLLVVIAILYVIGIKMTQSQPTTHTWGLRMATAVFVLSAIANVSVVESPAAEDLLWAVVSALFAAALTLGPAWIILAIGGFACGHMWQAEERSRRRAEERKLKRETKRREQEQRRQQAEYDRLAPERERAAREAETRRVAEEQARAESSNRREEALLACELLYNLRASDIGDRFNRDQFTHFVSTYMNESKPVDVLENRAKELQRLIQQHYETTNPPERFADLVELSEWYEKQKDEIEGLSLAPAYKQDILIQLNERYSELTERIMEKL